MGRIFLSPRLSVRVTAERWRRLSRVNREPDRTAFGRLTGMAVAHSSEAFFALDDPLEAVLVSIFIEISRRGD